MGKPRLVPWDVPPFCYLHTLTFADPEPSYAEARRRWENFRSGFLKRGGRFGVVVPQWGEQTRRLHFHLVTSVRWDAKEMWAVLPHYGFGRYDVRERPWAAAGYAARYVARRDYWPVELRGMRSWSVFGSPHWPPAFPPTGVRDVVVKQSQLTVVAEKSQGAPSVVSWKFQTAGDAVAFRSVLRSSEVNPPDTYMREISKEQTAEVLKLVAFGDIVGVGEYRSLVVETREMRNFKTQQKEQRVLVNHHVDFGTSCERRTFEELLPSGADSKAVTAPANSGDLVAVVVEGVKVFNGTTTYKGRVIQLSGQKALGVK